MKKKMVLALGIVMTLSMAMTACGKDASHSTQQEKASIPAQEAIVGSDPATWGPENSGSDVEIPNPFTDCATLEEAVKIAGFDFSSPDTVEGYGKKRIMAVENEMIQIIYTNADEPDNVNGEESNFESDVCLSAKQPEMRI